MGRFAGFTIRTSLRNYKLQFATISDLRSYIAVFFWNHHIKLFANKR